MCVTQLYVYKIVNEYSNIITYYNLYINYIKIIFVDKKVKPKIYTLNR